MAVNSGEPGLQTTCPDVRPMLIMSSEKTKKLLDNLKNITKKDRFAQKPMPSSTNRWWPSMSDVRKLPSSYTKAKHYKDEDGDEFIYVDRVYGGLFGHSSLEQKDGRTYTGKLYTKRRLLKGADGNNFYSPCTVTADGRWFDNCGWPIEPPKKLDIEPEEKPDEEDIEEQKRIAREREQRIIAGLK